MTPSAAGGAIGNDRCVHFLGVQKMASKRYGAKANTGFTLGGGILSLSRNSCIIGAKMLHMEELNAPSVDLVVDKADPRPMGIDFFARENKSEYNLNTRKKAKETELLLKNVEDDESMVTNYIILSDDEDSN